MSALVKNLLVIAALIMVGAAGYYIYYSDGGDSIITTSSSDDINSQAAFQTREFKSILNDLNSIDLDSSLLQDPGFLQLKDHSQPVVDRPFGRSNPFAS